MYRQCLNQSKDCVQRVKRWLKSHTSLLWKQQTLTHTRQHLWSNTSSNWVVGQWLKSPTGITIPSTGLTCWWSSGNWVSITTYFSRFSWDLTSRTVWNTLHKSVTRCILSQNAWPSCDSSLHSYTVSPSHTLSPTPLPVISNLFSHLSRTDRSGFSGSSQPKILPEGDERFSSAGVLWNDDRYGDGFGSQKQIPCSAWDAGRHQIRNSNRERESPNNPSWHFVYCFSWSPQLSLPMEHRRNFTVLYNKMKLSEIMRLAPNVRPVFPRVWKITDFSVWYADRMA